MNILILANLDVNFKKDIGPKTIQIGLFRPEEINQIKNGSYLEKDYNKRIFGSLSDLMHSDERVFRKKCMNDVYKRYYRIEINCNDFPLDNIFNCSQVSTVLIRLMYNYERKDYPIYNCGFRDNHGQCYNSYNTFSNSFGVYLVQSFNGKVELAWKGLAKCKLEEPKFFLNMSQKVLPCYSFN
ncbi:unnamed protein product [Brachionus calyciflorus]|uniref:Uncharacterized protein n=1 Tax=Brachionus calyciflorus TaxID=104777 RepID=A0A814E622_9BILA|nr:unnamed protein product [Brachionus calyciflorus]